MLRSITNRLSLIKCHSIAKRHSITNSHSSCARGFSLIELLMVTAIIGIMTTLIMPATQMIRDSSRKITCINNLKQIGMALIGYTSENRGFVPFSAGQLGTGQTGMDKRQLEFMLAPYFGAHQDSGGIDDYWTGISRLKTWVCPSSPITGYVPWGAVGDPNPIGIQYKYRSGKVGQVNAYEGAFQYLHWYKLQVTDAYPAVAYLTLRRFPNVSQVPFQFCSNRWQASAPDPTTPEWWYGCQGISWHPKLTRPTVFLDGHVVALISDNYTVGGGMPNSQTLLITPLNYQTYACQEY